MPCNMCTQFEYKCYFEKHPRKRSKLVEQNAYLENSSDYIKAEPPKEDRPNVEDVSKMRSMEANSGIAFTRLLGQRLDPSAGPKLLTFGWNLGTGSHVSQALTPITDFLGQDQMYQMSKLYFENAHPLYGFLDKECILENMSLRWAQPALCKVPDHVFIHIAAVGSLFSDGAVNAIVPSMMDSGKKALDNSIMAPPELYDVQSWLLRCLYLRATDHPHAVHMSSCIAIHLVEALGLHQESTSPALHPQTGEQSQDVEIRRRTFWIARMLNTWVSFEYGRTRVVLRGITAELPAPKSENDYTIDYVNLYSLSCCLDPERNDSKWEDFLRQLEGFEARHDGIELSRANLGT